jgi:hypothetical protein
VGLPELAETAGALKGQGRKHDLEEGGVTISTRRVLREDRYSKGTAHN